MEEGQFDECDLSLRDLRVVADSFATTMNAVYHPRVEYPEPTERERTARRSLVGRVPAPPATAIPPATRGTSAEFSEDTPGIAASDSD